MPGLNDDVLADIRDSNRFYIEFRNLLFFIRF